MRDATCTTITKVDLFGALAQEPNPYVYVFSFETQAELMKNLVFKMGYQGSRSRKLVRTVDVNRLIPGDTFDTEPQPDEFQETGSNGQPCDPTNPTCLAPHAVGNNRFKSIFIPFPDVNASARCGNISTDSQAITWLSKSTAFSPGRMPSIHLPSKLALNKLIHRTKP